MNLLRPILLFVLVCSLSILPTEATPIFFDDPDVCNTEACQEAAQSLRDSMDTSADPCQNFYRYACGGWIDTHPIPADQTSYSTTDLMSKQLNSRVAELLRSAANEDHIKPITQAVTFFMGCMDEDAREEQGLEPLKRVLNSVGGWPMASSEWSDDGYLWQEKVADSIRLTSTAAIVKIGVDADARESSRHIVLLDQADFGLGRDQLLDRETERNAEIVEAYRDYMVQSAKLLNPDADEDDLIAEAQEVIDFEAALAKFSKPPEEKKDPEAWYHKMSTTEADTVTENTYFKWKDFLNIILQGYHQMTDETDIIVSDIDFLKNAIRLAHNIDERTVANYIGWMIVKSFAEESTRELRHIAFVYDNTVTGIAEPPKLESKCTENVNQLFGFAVARLYVDEYFSEQEKRDVEAILEDIHSTYELTLNHNPWMDPVTKNRALEKLRSITDMVAYPDWIKNDQELINYYHTVPDLKEEEYFESALKAMKSLMARSLKQWNEATHKTTEWVTSPAVVNAFYNPSANTITFPAGILNLPLYKYGRSLALNYGAIGSVIGHEISHGFDDTGSKFDKEGNLVNWWLKETKDQFDSKTTCFKRQYSSYEEPTTQTMLNGNLTIGDDVADNGGVRNAFLAYQVHVLEQNDIQTTVPNKRLPGIDATSDQLFFLGYASTYCWHEQPETLEWTIRYSDHTIDKYRVVVPLSNSRDFAEAFNCPRGSPMNPESKCVLW